MDELKIQWHPAFCSAMELILRRDKGHLEFIREYNLNTKPLEMDLLVIKKPAGYEVGDEIGRIFREHNIFEYKSPDDKMNIDTFYKVNAYASLYKASAPHVDGIKADNITITMVRETKPVKMLRCLEMEKFSVSRPYKGIYYIGGKAYFQTQIVVAKELAGEQYVWLQALTRRLDREKAKKLIWQAGNCKEQGDGGLADAVLSVSVNANHVLFDREKEDAEMFEALKELMADEINERSYALGEIRGEARGEERGEASGLKALVDVLKGMSLDFDSAYQAIIKTETYAKVPREQVMKHWK